ncbi:MAG: iron-sulfur cluster assembly accessory protein [Proteobacteria bacterium]|nr:iron-sulfur cluster assembly accessory protein [Pseudomonadota bacterium]
MASDIEIKTASILLTHCAKAAVVELTANQIENRSRSLRLYLEGKGCDGFYYGVTFDEPSIEDVRFPQLNQLNNDFLIDVVVDPETLQFVEGSEIDWVDDERGRGFLVNNPNQKSFRGKFFKREAWKKKLAGQLPGASSSKTGTYPETKTDTQ